MIPLTVLEKGSRQQLLEYINDAIDELEANGTTERASEVALFRSTVLAVSVTLAWIVADHHAARRHTPRPLTPLFFDANLTLNTPRPRTLR